MASNAYRITTCGPRTRSGPYAWTSTASGNWPRSAGLSCGIGRRRCPSRPGSMPRPRPLRRKVGGGVCRAARPGTGDGLLRVVEVAGGKKQPSCIFLPDGPMTFAGIWETWHAGNDAEVASGAVATSMWRAKRLATVLPRRRSPRSARICGRWSAPFRLTVTGFRAYQTVDTGPQSSKGVFRWLAPKGEGCRRRVQPDASTALGRMIPS